MNCSKCHRSDLSSVDFYSGNRWVCRSCVCARTTETRRRREAKRQAEKRTRLAEQIASGVKCCAKCLVVKPRAAFHIKRDSPDQLFRCCKACHYAAGKRWREENPEKTTAAQRRRRLLNLEKARAKSRAAYYKYRDRYEAYRKKYASEHPRKYGPAQLLRGSSATGATEGKRRRAPNALRLARDPGGVRAPLRLLPQVGREADAGPRCCAPERRYSQCRQPRAGMPELQFAQEQSPGVRDGVAWLGP